jgi:hypothetical protein
VSGWNNLGVRRALTWLLALPVMVVGCQVAHSIAYWWAYPQSNLRAGILAHTGHGYLAYTPIALGFLGAIEAVVFIVAVLDRVRGRPIRALPPWAFLLVPVLGFAFQEHFERLVLGGNFPWWTVVAPSFWRGLVLQFPLGLIAFLIARLLLRTAEVVADGMAARYEGWPVTRRRATVGRRPTLVLLPRRAPLADAAAGRAPPLFVH